MRNRSSLSIAVLLAIAVGWTGCDSDSGSGSGSPAGTGGTSGSSMEGAVLWAGQTFWQSEVHRLDLGTGTLRTFQTGKAVRKFLVDAQTTYGVTDDTMLHRFPRVGAGAPDSCRLPWMPGGAMDVRDGRIYAYRSGGGADPRLVVLDGSTCAVLDSTYASTRNNDYDGVRADADGLWILVHNGFQLLRLDPSTLRKTDSVPLGSPPSVPDSFAVLYGYGDLTRIGSRFWVLDAYRRRLVAIDVSPVRRVGHWDFEDIGLRDVPGPSLQAVGDWLIVRDRDDTVKVVDPSHLLEGRAGSPVRATTWMDNRDLVAGGRHLLAEAPIPTNARMLDQLSLPGLATGSAIGLPGLAAVFALDD